MPKPYQEPEGFYDQPFTWIWNSIGFTPGSTLLNQAVHIERPTGHFVLRRSAGYKSVLDNTTGKFTIRDSQGNALEEQPEHVSPDSDELVFLPELFYPSLGQINFDLYNLL